MIIGVNNHPAYGTVKDEYYICNLLWKDKGCRLYFIFRILHDMGGCHRRFLLLKQGMAPAGEIEVYDGPYVYSGIDDDPNIRVDGGDMHGPKASIKGLFGDYIGRKYALKSGESCRIGRDSSCDIQIRLPKVSRIHCSVKFLPDGRFEVVDTSYNGTFYENAALPNGVATVVKAGGCLVIGEADNVLELKVD